MRRPSYVFRLACLWVLGLALPASFVSADDDFKVVEPASVGLDGEKLAELDALFAEEVEAGRIAGCLALVARGDQVAYLETWGYRDREAESPLSNDAIFRIYSMSKPITSVATMMMVEEGKLSLDEPVSTYLPAFADLKVLVASSENGETVYEEVPVENEMTVRDLLRHTSGLTYGFFGDGAVDRRYLEAGVLSRDATLEEMIDNLGSLPLKHQPGTRFEYSVSTDVLGRLVEVASGQRYDRFLQERIFAPLDMRDTFFIVPEDKRDRLAQMYSPNDEGGLRPANRYQSRRFLSEHEFFSGGGGLCSTTRDYLRFCQMLLNDGELDGARLLQPESVAEMTRDQLPGAGERRGGFQFGLGFSITPRGDYGWGGAAGTRFWIDPENDLIGIFMIQINPQSGAGYPERMKQIVYEALR